MGRQAMMLALSVGLWTLSFVPSVWAADEPTAEAAEVGSPTGTTPLDVDQLRAAIATEPDPELREAMQEQLELLESGQLDLDRELALGAPELGAPGGAPELIGPPVDGNPSTMPDYMTPELREQLFNVYDQVAAGGLSEQDARAQAEAILREHGIDPREVGPGHDREFDEHMREQFEQMSPEAREQMEQYREQMESYREQMEHEFHAPEHEMESMTREYEAPLREQEASFEAPEQPQVEPPEGMHPEGGMPQ